MNKETKTKRRRGWSARARVGVPLPVNQLFTQHLSLVLNLWYEFIIFRNTGMLESNVKVRSRTRRTGNPPNPGPVRSYIRERPILMGADGPMHVLLPERVHSSLHVCRRRVPPRAPLAARGPAPLTGRAQS